MGETGRILLLPLPGKVVVPVNKKLKTFIAALIIVLFVGVTAAALAAPRSVSAPERPEGARSDVQAADNFNAYLGDTKTVTLRRKMLSLHRTWEVFVNDKQVATITGKNLASFRHDTYHLATEDNVLVASMKDDFSFMLRRGALHDTNGEATYSMKQNFSPFLKKYTYKSDKNSMVVQERIRAFGFAFDVEDAAGNVTHEARSTGLSKRFSEMEVTRVGKSDALTADMLLAVVHAAEANLYAESQNSKSSK